MIQLDALMRLLVDDSAEAAPVHPAASWRALLEAGTDPVCELRGRDPAPWGAGPSALLRFAAERELVLARLRHQPPAPYRMVRVIRTPPSVARPSLVRHARASLAAGAAVLLHDGSVTGSPLDDVIVAAGLDEHGWRVRPRSGGVLLLLGRRAGEPVLLRVGSPKALPAASAEGLRRLSGSPLVPRLLASSRDGDPVWTLEELLPGRRPARLGVKLLSDAVNFAAAMPPSAEDPEPSTIADLAPVLPRHADMLRTVGDQALAVVRDGLPAVAVHGDYWTGNLLTSGRRLTGVVDWDAFRSSGPAGVDLLHLVASEDRHRHGRGIGAEALLRPWASEEFASATAPYWGALGVKPTECLLDALGVVWWLQQIASTLARTPSHAADEKWVAANVTRVLGAFGG